MTMFYSAQTQGFYDSTIHGDDKIPEDAVEITEDDRNALIQGQSIGKIVVIGDDGKPELTAPPPESVTIRRTRAITSIDTKAGAVRTAFASNGAFVDAEYEQALANAKSWTEADRPADAVPDDIQAWADATGNSAEWAAQDIINTAAAWSEALTAIRRVRLVGKEAVRQAADDADFDAIAAEYLAQLDQIAAAVPEEA